MGKSPVGYVMIVGVWTFNIKKWNKLQFCVNQDFVDKFII